MDKMVEPKIENYLDFISLLSKASPAVSFPKTMVNFIGVYKGVITPVSPSKNNDTKIQLIPNYGYEVAFMLEGFFDLDFFNGREELHIFDKGVQIAKMEGSGNLENIKTIPSARDNIVISDGASNPSYYYLFFNPNKNNVSGYYYAPFEDNKELMFIGQITLEKLK